MEELDVAQCWLTLILSPHTMGPKRVTAVSKKLQTAIFARSKKGHMIKSIMHAFPISIHRISTKIHDLKEIISHATLP
jgi:hypothetical protein